MNLEKTKIVKFVEARATPGFLGFTFRYDKDLFGRNGQYPNIFPSERSVTREREKQREMTNRKKCFCPVPALIA